MSMIWEIKGSSEGFFGEINFSWQRRRSLSSAVSFFSLDAMVLSHRAIVYRVCGVALIFLAAVFIYQPGISPRSSYVNSKSSFEKAQRPGADHSAEGWEWNPERDSTNYGLSEAQCDATFPGLWKELERAVEHRHKVGNITEKDVDISWRKQSMVRAMIYDRQVSRTDIFFKPRGNRAWLTRPCHSCSLLTPNLVAAARTIASGALESFRASIAP